MRERSSGHLSSMTPAGGRPNSARYMKLPPPPRPPILRLVFQLPPALGLVAPGKHQPNPQGCQLEIAPDGMVCVTGPSRMEIFDHARRFLRLIAKGKPACAIAAVLRSPPGHWIGSSGFDGWTIVINSEIAFAPTATGVEVEPTAV